MPTIAVNGTDLYYHEVGTGLPCLVLHGGLGYNHSYQHAGLDPLGDVLTLVYYDLRGHGRSGRPPLTTLTFDQFCADNEALRAHLGYEQVALLGQSFGSYIALEYALRYPERVSHLILLGASAHFRYWAEIQANIQRKAAGTPMEAEFLRRTEANADDKMRRMRAIAPLYFHRYDPEVAWRLFQRMTYSPEAGALTNPLLRTFDITDRLGDIHAPTLIIVGRDDFITPPSQAAVVQAGIPGAELVIMEQSGHFPYAEEPEAFEAAVRGWLARTAPPGTGAAG